VLLSGCGGSATTASTGTMAATSTASSTSTGASDSTTASDSSMATASPSMGATGAPDAATDKVAALKLVLVRSDVPSGWTETAATPPSADAQAVDDQLNACVGMPPRAKTQVVSVDGSTFAQGNNSISSTVNSLKTAQLVQQDFAGSSNPKSFTCIKNLLNAALQKAFVTSVPGAKVSSTITALRGVVTGKDQFAFRVLSVMTLKGKKTNIYTDMLGLRAGRFEVSISLNYIGAAPSAALEKALFARAAAHVSGTAAV
jgi:hypothetical protein